MAVHVPESQAAPSGPQPFVGRGLEYAHLRAFVQGAPSGAVCAVEAEAGFGKTALLDELWRALPELALERLWVDARRHQAGDVEVLARLTLPPGPPVVVFLDSWDHLAPTLNPLFAPLPSPARDVRVTYVVAARSAPGPMPPGMSDRLRLGHLSPHEIDSWLSRYGFPANDRARVVARTYGDPLAVALAIDIAQVTGAIAVPEPGVPAREALADRFMEACAKSARRMALLALAVASPVDAPGMRRALGQPDVEVAMRWLERLAVVRPSPCGLSLQPFVAAHLVRHANPADRLLAEYAASRIGCPRPD